MNNSITQAGPCELPAHNSDLLALNYQLSTLNHWYCVRTHCKREHLAARWLAKRLGLEVYLPRIRFRRALERGMVWFTEALFPNYLFARFELGHRVQGVECAPGVQGVVRFGAHCPAVPDAVIEALRRSVGAEEIRVIDDALEPGQGVRLAGGPFHGLEAVIERVVPGRQRVVVLLEFLGRQMMVELAADAVTRVGDRRETVLGD